MVIWVKDLKHKEYHQPKKPTPQFDLLCQAVFKPAILLLKFITMY